jgi:uncharacterized repeat protein (TIGR03987 family)
VDFLYRSFNRPGLNSQEQVNNEVKCPGGKFLDAGVGMSIQVMLSIILISLALLFYSIGVWSERLVGRLRGWHLIFFWAGLAFDTLGTGLMFEMAGGFTSGVHALTGMLAILLMLLHALWASLVLARKDERMILNFHKFSLGVWLIWLVPYLNGFFLSMGD